MTKANPPRTLGRPPSMTDPRSKICAAAAGLIAENGYASTSIQEVADAVGITKAGVYHYFRNKLALYETIALETLSDMLATVQNAVAQADDHEGRLVAFMCAHAEFFEANRSRYMASFFGFGGQNNREYTPAQLEARDAYISFLESLLSAAQKDGVIIQEEVPILSRGVLGMLNWMARWYRPNGDLAAREIAERYAKVFWRGIALT